MPFVYDDYETFPALKSYGYLITLLLNSAKVKYSEI